MALRPKSLAFAGVRLSASGLLNDVRTPPSGKAWVFKECRYAVHVSQVSAPAPVITLYQETTGLVPPLQQLVLTHTTPSGLYTGTVTDSDMLFGVNDGVNTPLQFRLSADPGGTSSSVRWSIVLVGIEIDL